MNQTNDPFVEGYKAGWQAGDQLARNLTLVLIPCGLWLLLHC